MQLIYGDLFKPETYTFVDGTPARMRISAIVITTNGFVKKTGDIVMGRGCAKRAADMYPKLPLKLGRMVRDNGNRVLMLGEYEGRRIVSFPVKPSGAICAPGKVNVVKHMRDKMTEGQMVPGWACVASLALIKRSALQLANMADEQGWANIVLPRPGVGTGELDWSDVRPALDEILNDSFYSITFGGHK